MGSKEHLNIRILNQSSKAQEKGDSTPYTIYPIQYASVPTLVRLAVLTSWRHGGVYFGGHTLRGTFLPSAGRCGDALPRGPDVLVSLAWSAEQVDVSGSDLRMLDKVSLPRIPREPLYICMYIFFFWPWYPYTKGPSTPKLSFLPDLLRLLSIKPWKCQVAEVTSTSATIFWSNNQEPH